MFIFITFIKLLSFESYNISFVLTGMFGLCVGVAVFTFLYEAVKALRHYLVILQMRRRDSSNVSTPETSRASQHNLFSWLNPSPQKTFEK